MLEQVLLTLHMPSPKAVIIVLQVSSQVSIVHYTAISFWPKMGLPDAPEMSKRLGLLELVFTCVDHIVRDKIESLGCCLSKSNCLNISSFGLNSEIYFSL